METSQQNQVSRFNSILDNLVKLQQNITSIDLAEHLSKNHTQIKRSLQSSFGELLQTVGVPGSNKPATAFILTRDIMRVYKRGIHYPRFRQAVEDRGLDADSTTIPRQTQTQTSQQSIPLPTQEHRHIPNNQTYLADISDPESTLNQLDVMRLQDNTKIALESLKRLQQIRKEELKLPLTEEDKVGQHYRYYIREVIEDLERIRLV